MDEDQVREYLEGMNTPFSTDEMLGVHKLMQEELKSDAKPKKNEPTWFISDPLSFDFFLDVDEAQEIMEEEAMFADEFEAQTGESADRGEGFSLMVAPDALHKANYSGDTYEIHLPDAKADTRLIGTDYYFVAYLRESFAWGGFPGLKDHKDCDEKLIAMLKEGLEPI
jgi:hypothetical protein